MAAAAEADERATGGVPRHLGPHPPSAGACCAHGDTVQLWWTVGLELAVEMLPAGAAQSGPLALTSPPPASATAAALQAATAPELDPEYKMALARTRQATAIHRAIGFLNTGERARCVQCMRSMPPLPV